jgi:MFS family permease
MLVVGRVVAGLCVGISSSICPVYQAEIAPKEIRGRVVSLQQWAITWGILIQYFIQYGASNVDGGPNNLSQSTAAFRIPWGIQIIPAVILFFGMFFLPRSPRWLASKDRWEEAIQVMAHLHGGGDINHPKVLAEYQEIEEALRFEREEAISSYKQLVERRMLKRVLLGMSIQMWSQLCGMNVMMYYVVCKISSLTSINGSLLTRFRHYGRCQHCLSTSHGFGPIHLECRPYAPSYHLPRSIWPSPIHAYRLLLNDDLPLCCRGSSKSLRSTKQATAYEFHELGHLMDHQQ